MGRGGAGVVGWEPPSHPETGTDRPFLPALTSIHLGFAVWPASWVFFIGSSSSHRSSKK